MASSNRKSIARIEKLKNDEFSGQSIELTIKFAPPRVPNEYEQDWLIEYHKKGEVGLARTLRRISLKTKAATKLMKTFELKPATGEFANVLPNTGT